MSTPINQLAFTRRDLVVVVAVIGLGFGLFVVFARDAREEARRTQCTDNLKHIGLGIQYYHDIRQEIPPSYLTDDQSSRALPSGFITWPLLLRPFIGAGNEYDLIDIAVSLDQKAPPPADHGQIAALTFPLYFCPTRRTPSAHTLGKTAYAVGDYGSVSLAEAVEGQVDRAAPRTWDAAMLPSRVFNTSKGANTVPLGGFAPKTLGGRDFRSMTNFKSITDGLANTAFLGEKAVREDRLGHAGAAPGEQDGPFYFGRGGDPADLKAPGAIAFWSRRLAPADSSERLLTARPRWEDPANRFGGWHPGVTLFLMGDGSVKPVSNDTTTLVLQRLGCRNDKQDASANGGQRQ